MKKKLIIIVSVVAALALVASGVVFLPKILEEAKTPDAPEPSTAEKVPEAEKITQTVEIAEPVENENILQTELIIKNKEHSFTVMKTDFENRYSEEELMEFSSVLSMSFGYDDYYNWNGEAESVVNELLNNCLTSSKWVFSSLVTDDEELMNKASRELALYLNDENARVDYGLVKLEDLNAYIKDMYGENARTFTGEDFMSVEEAVKNNGKVFDYNSDMYSQIRYFPQNDLLWLASRDTGYYSTITYIYNITEENGEYIVYTLRDFEDYSTGNTFSSQQSYVLEALSWDERNCLYTSVCTLGISENGDFYLKNVEEKCIFADGFSGDYVVKCDADLYEWKTYNQPFTKIGTVKKGTVVTIGVDYFTEEYEYILNEDFAGYIKPENLEKIE